MQEAAQAVPSFSEGFEPEKNPLELSEKANLEVAWDKSPALSSLILPGRTIRASLDKTSIFDQLFGEVRTLAAIFQPEGREYQRDAT